MPASRCTRWAPALLAALLAGPHAPGEEVRVPCRRDVWVSAVPSERDHGMGRTPRLKLKTIQEMAILDFDLSPLTGRTVAGGWLYLHVVDNPAEVARMNLPFARRHLLRRIGLSTVATDWVEGLAAREYAIDRTGSGATFREASYTKRPWAWPGSDLSAVIFGSGHTLQAHAELEEHKGLWVRVAVPPRLIRSLICRDAFGLCVMDEIGYGLANNFIHSREARGFEPYLVVRATGRDGTSPAAPRVAVRPAPAAAHMASGAAAIDVDGPADAFCYFVTVNGRAVPRWRTPHPKAGRARILLDDRTAGEALSVQVVACDAAGNRSPAAKATGRASPALVPPPKLPPAWQPTAGEPPVRAGRMRVWALPEACKVDPVTGALFEAKALGAEPLAYRRANSVWDGATGSVRVFGAAGEIVAFQLCVARTRGGEPLKGIAVRFAGLSGPGPIPAGRVRLYRVWYTPVPEYAVPMKAGETLAIPNGSDRAGETQRNQLVYVDIAIPQGAKVGEYRGKVTISAEGVAAFDVPVRLRVYGFSIPDRLRFNPELNIYRAPARPGSETWFACFRAAHYNRCTLSLTMAGHGDGINGGMGLPIAGDGAAVRVADWRKWDAAYGPLLDGSAFRLLPRASVPLATCQVPLSHGSPLKLDRYYRYDGPRKHKNVGLAHALLCKPIDEAFGDDYKRGFQSFARQVAGHFGAKGWRRTDFQFYLDAKVMWRVRGGGTSYWTLDEPYNYDDWAALRFWGRLFRHALRDVPARARWGFRCDISRPQWTHDWLRGVMTTMYVGGLERQVRTVQRMAAADPELRFYAYGACNPPAASNWNSVGWCLATFLAGGEGVLPWQSLGNAASLRKPDRLALIVPNAAGHGAVASVRVMALRRGAQDCEYLLTLGERYGLNREQLRALVAGKVLPKARSTALHEDDAAPVAFDRLDPAAFAALREGVAKLIEGRAREGGRLVPHSD